MKSQPFPQLMPTVALGAALLLAGCEQDAISTVQLGAAVNTSLPVLLAEATPPAEAATPAAPAQPAPQQTNENRRAASPPPVLSPGVDEVVQLAQAQVGDEVLLAYIENSPAAFNLQLSEILYLNDLGISAPVIAAMVRRSEARKEPAPAVATPPAANPPPAEPVAETPAPTAVAVTTPPSSTSTPVVQHVTNNYFYDTLAPYGTWLEVPDYGWCWRPTVAVIDTTWRPYCHGGRWIYTDCGWYWHSYYSWGWAPFHYGRWHMSPSFGWVWAPDTCWGPAWVTWRYYDGYYGWAPLPPGCGWTTGIGLTYYGGGVGFSFGFGLGASCYSFIPVRHFYSPRPYNHCVLPSRVGSVYQNSTVINNYIHGDGNNVVVNVGPGTAKIEAATRSEIPKARIRDVTAGELKTVGARALSTDGKTLAAYRPSLPDQASTPPPEISRRQIEGQKRSAQVANSEAARAAVVKARSTPSPTVGSAAASELAKPMSSSPRQPQAEQNVPGGKPAASTISRKPAPSSPSRPESARPNPVAGPQKTGSATAPPDKAGSWTVSPTTPRSEPTRQPNAAPSTPAPRPTRESEPTKSSAPRPAQRAEAAAPQRQASAPAWTAPAPTRSPRAEPSRSVNPSYVVTPSAANSSPLSRSELSRPSPSVTPAPRWGVQPSQNPGNPRPTPAPSFTPGPARTLEPSPIRREFSSPVPAPAISAPPRAVIPAQPMPSAPSPSIRSAPSDFRPATPSPSISPVSRSGSAPSSSPRSGGPRER